MIRAAFTLLWILAIVFVWLFTHDNQPSGAIASVAMFAATLFVMPALMRIARKMGA